MSSADWTISGFRELGALLDQLPRRWAQRIVRNGTRAGAVVIQKSAKSRVRRKTGKLEKTIKVTSRIEGDLIIARVRLKGYHSFLGYFLEYGVLPHLITVSEEDRPLYKTRHGPRRLTVGTMNRRNKELGLTGSLVIGENFVGPFVHHPGHPAFPFMRPALDEDGHAAVNAMAEYVRSHLTWGELESPKTQVIEDEE